MATRAQTIKTATEQARKSWYEYTIRQEQEMLALYEGAAQKLIKEIQYNTKADIIVKARRETLLREINQQCNFLRASLNRKIRSGMSQSIDLGLKSGIYTMNAVKLKGINVGTSYIGVDGNVRKYDAAQTTLNTSMWGRINQDAMEYLVRYRPGGIEFSDSIWDATWEVQKQMRRMVNESVLLGKSSQNLAMRLTKYVSKTGLKTGPGIYKSAYANAWRLARTEMNRAYTEGQIRYAGKKDFIDGFIWRTGNTDACHICRGLNGKFFPKDEVPEIPHPNCMCWREWHIKDEAIEEAA